MAWRELPLTTQTLIERGCNVMTAWEHRTRGVFVIYRSPPDTHEQRIAQDLIPRYVHHVTRGDYVDGAPMVMQADPSLFAHVASTPEQVLIIEVLL